MIGKKTPLPEERQERKTGRRDGHQIPFMGGPTRSCDLIGPSFSFIGLDKENIALQKHPRKIYEFAG